MIKFISIGGAVGCVVGGIVSKFYVTESTKPIEINNSAIGSSLEKLEGLSSKEGRAVCEELSKSIAQICVTVDLIREKQIPDKKTIGAVQLACTRTGRAHQLLEKLYCLERNRNGSLEEFTIYRTTLDEELNGIGSELNNYLTNNITTGFSRY